MIKKTLTYDGFDGPVTNDFYFHLSKADLAILDSNTPGGFASKIVAIEKANTLVQAIGLFQEIISAAVGERDGERFIKSPAISQGFISSPAFDTLIDDLITSEGSAAQFTRGLLPTGLVDEQEVQRALMEGGFSSAAAEGSQVQIPNKLPLDDHGLKSPHDEKGELLPWAFREPSDKEIHEMTHPQLQDIFVRRSSNWTPPIS